MPKISQSRREARRRDILEAALACFAENGFHQAGMADIVRRSGMSHGAVYGYFHSKDDIIEALADDRHSREAILNAAVASDDPLAGFIALARAYAASLADPSGELRRRVGVHGWAEALRSPRVRARVVEGIAIPRGWSPGSSRAPRAPAASRRTSTPTPWRAVSSRCSRASRCKLSGANRWTSTPAPELSSACCAALRPERGQRARREPKHDGDGRRILARPSRRLQRRRIVRVLGVSPGGALTVFSALLMGAEQHVAQGLSLIAQIPPTSLAGLRRYREADGEIPRRWLAPLIPGFVAGGIVGAAAAACVAAAALRWTYVGYLVALDALLILRRPRREEDDASRQEDASLARPALFAVGALAGISSGFLGIGGGLAIVAGLAPGSASRSGVRRWSPSR